MKPYGSDVRRLTDASTSGSRFDSSPNWSPDGTKLVFERVGDFPNTDIELFSVSRDGREETRITHDPRLNLEPAWSPDGTKIVMHSTELFELEYDVEVINADGSGRTFITSGPDQDVDPDWQPIPGPQRSDNKTGAKFCEAERDFLGDPDFAAKYGGGADAYGKCVSQSH
jgi:dipeptidyl aminopeptidase/acylaminoacyl peptidase